MAHPRGARRFNTKSSRLTQWIGPADQGYLSVATGAKAIVSSLSFEEPNTIMRSRGVVSVAPDTFGADVEFKGAYGKAIVSTDALVAGAASVPGPWTDPDWGGWYVWRSFAYFFEFSDATGLRNLAQNFEVDSKSMRKVSPNESLVTIAESQAGAFQIFSGVRTLIKLT